jgi:hypothetical protein
MRLAYLVSQGILLKPLPSFLENKYALILSRDLNV